MDVKKLCLIPCWSVKAGEGTGSNVSISFGDKVLFKRPLKNPCLSEEERKYDGEYGLYITCSWRIDSDFGVVCSSKEPNLNNGPMVKGLRNLLNANVTDIVVSKPAFDLILHFDNKCSLKIFCDETDVDEPFDNYSFFTPSISYTVTNRSGLALEKREFY